MTLDALRERAERFRQFLQQDPDNINIISELIDIELQLGHFEQVQVLLSAGLTKFPDNTGLKFKQASFYLATAQQEQAIRQLQDLLDAGVHAPAVYFNYAYAALLNNDPELAQQQLAQITDIELLPDYNILLSRVQHHLGDMENAIRSAHAQLNAQPENAEALGHLALLYLDTLQHQQAAQALEKSPLNREALITMGSVALDEQDIVQARGYFELAVKEHANAGRAWSGMGLVKMAEMDLVGAIEDLTLAVKYMPEYIGTWHALAWAQIMQQELDAAEQSFQAALDIDRIFGETHGGLAVVAVMRGDLEDAERKARIGLRLNPQSFAARFAQSLLTQHSGDQAAAVKQIEAILASEIMPGCGKLQDALQRMQMLNRANATKLQIGQQVSEINSDNDKPSLH